MNIIEKKLICGKCYRTKLTFFDSEVTLPLEINHMVTKDFYTTLKLSNFDYFICETAIFYTLQRAYQCLSCAERVIELYK